MVAPLHMPVSRERMSRYVQLLRITLHVASGGPEYYFQEDIIAGFAEMLSGGMAKMILEHQKAPEHTSRERFILDRFMDLVQKNCREHRDLAFYADALYLSPKYLSRIVSRVSGRRAVDLIRENVISEAQLLLSQGELNVQQVSHMLNFPNPSYFGRYYLKATGETPMAFQRRKQ
jgi:AraC-like DNA-binding protein